MRLSPVRIVSLQKILKDQYGLEVSDEQAQEAGMSIMRFVKAKYLRRQELASQKRRYGNGQDDGTTKSITRTAN